jgi:hypothetical protein
VDDAVGVGAGQRVGHLHADVDDFRHRHRAVVLQEPGQGRPFDQLHDDVGEVTVAAGVVGRDDVGMGQLGRGDRLAPKTRTERVVAGEVRMQHLDGDAPGEHFVLGFPDGRHPSAGQLPMEAITSSENVFGGQRFHSAPTVVRAGSHLGTPTMRESLPGAAPS